MPPTKFTYESTDCPNCGENATVQWGEIEIDGCLVKKWLIHLVCDANCQEQDLDAANKAAEEYGRRHGYPPSS